ncbi:MAG: efflux RND transporter permease subunit, partial [Muribaculaceae bacterium]|nr:efflux RND transporter permease subunit [Muribaculaceae bacterium]
MLNKIIGIALNNRILVVILSGVVALAAMVLLFRTEVDIFPDLNAPTVVVMTEAQGLAPEEVEKLVSYPIETAVNGATGVRRVRSQSATGFSVVWVEFDWDTEIYRARQIVTEKISAMAETLPPGVSSPVLGPQSSILGEIMIIGLTSDSLGTADLRSIADRELRPRLLAIGGVSQVAVIGGDVQEYQIRLKPELMNHYGISLNEALEALTDVNRNAAGGVIYEYGNEYLIKGHFNTRSLED